MEAIKALLGELRRCEIHNDYKEVFYMKALGELPFSVIAEVFGKTESWARVTYHRARAKISERLGDFNE